MNCIAFWTHLMSVFWSIDICSMCNSHVHSTLNAKWSSRVGRCGFTRYVCPIQSYRVLELSIAFALQTDKVGQHMRAFICTSTEHFSPTERPTLECACLWRHEYA